MSAEGYRPVGDLTVRVRCDRCSRILDHIYGTRCYGIEDRCRAGIRIDLGHQRDLARRDVSDPRKWRYRCVCGNDVPVLVDKLDRAFREAVFAGRRDIRVPLRVAPDLSRDDVLNWTQQLQGP